MQHFSDRKKASIISSFSSRRGAIYDASQVKSGAIYDAPQVRSGAIYDAANSRRVAIFHASKFHFLLKINFTEIDFITHTVNKYLFHFKCDYCWRISLLNFN